MFLLGLASAAAALPPALGASLPVAWLIPDAYELPSDGGDDAQAIQRAINAACAVGERGDRGGVIRLLPRHYNIRSQIVIKHCRVTLEGAGYEEAPDSSGSKPEARPIIPNILGAAGTWLDIRSNFRGKADGGAPILITQHSPIDIESTGTVLRDIAFSEPDQPLPKSASREWVPDEYPPVIFDYNTGGLIRLSNLYFHGVYRGITAYNAGRVVANGIYGQFFAFAISLDQITDNSIIRNVRNWPYWSSNNAVMTYQQAHAATLISDRVDTPFYDELVSFATNAGIIFGTGAQGGATTRALIGRVSCDSNVHCLDIEAHGVSANVDQLETFGQSQVKQGEAYIGATAIQIGGDVVLLVGQLSSAFVDQFTIQDTNKIGCSNIRVSNLTADFRASKHPSVALFDGEPCGGSYSQLLVGSTPRLIVPADTRFTNGAGGGVRVYYPRPTEQP